MGAVVPAPTKHHHHCGLQRTSGSSAHPLLKHEKSREAQPVPLKLLKIEDMACDCSKSFDVSGSGASVLFN